MDSIIKNPRDQTKHICIISHSDACGQENKHSSSLFLFGVCVCESKYCTSDGSDRHFEIGGAKIFFGANRYLYKI